MFEKKYFVAVFLLVLVILLNLPVPASKRIKSGAHDAAAPFQNVMSLLVNDVREAFSYLLRASKAGDEQRQMQEKIAALNLQVQSLRSLEIENNELREQVGFKKKQKHKLVMGEVVSRGDASGWWQTVTINRGTDEGVRLNMPVISVNGLIGRVKDLSKHTSDVLLITDPTSRVGAKFSRTGALGLIRGGGVSVSGTSRLEMLCAAEPCRMEFVSKEQKLFTGDEVVTSGLGGIYPEGLLIGKAAVIGMDASSLYQVVDVVPTAKLGSLRYIFVVVE
ncbi:MAG: rod shape-determining protein MreC [Verrucomicrobia bacterium]|nr:rod shape-determining protein MreC [Verrucomicrobiota bacterium]